MNLRTTRAIIRETITENINPNDKYDSPVLLVPGGMDLLSSIVDAIRSGNTRTQIKNNLAKIECTSVEFVPVRRTLGGRCYTTNELCRYAAKIN